MTIFAADLAGRSWVRVARKCGVASSTGTTPRTLSTTTSIIAATEAITSSVGSGVIASSVGAIAVVVIRGVGVVGSGWVLGLRFSVVGAESRERKGVLGLGVYSNFMFEEKSKDDWRRW